MKKKFSQKLHTENDLPARRAFIRKINEDSLMYHARESSDKYAIDIEIYNKYTDKFYCYVELEARPSWAADRDFEYKTVHIPYRKKKFFQHDKIVKYVVMNNDFTGCLMVDSADIVTSNVIYIDTKYTINEKFYDVNLEKFHYIDLR